MSSAFHRFPVPSVFTLSFHMREKTGVYLEILGVDNKRYTLARQVVVYSNTRYRRHRRWTLTPHDEADERRWVFSTLRKFLIAVRFRDHMLMEHTTTLAATNPLVAPSR